MSDPSALETAARELVDHCDKALAEDQCPLCDGGQCPEQREVCFVHGPDCPCDTLRAALDAEPSHPPPCDYCGDPASGSVLDHVVGARFDYCPDHDPRENCAALDAEPVELDSPDSVHPGTTELATRGYERVNRDAEPVGEVNSRTKVFDTCDLARFGQEQKDKGHAAGRAERDAEVRVMVKGMIANLWKHQGEAKRYLGTVLAKLPTPESSEPHPPPCDTCGRPSIESVLDHVVGGRVDYCPDHAPTPEAEPSPLGEARTMLHSGVDVACTHCAFVRIGNVRDEVFHAHDCADYPTPEASPKFADPTDEQVRSMDDYMTGRPTQPPETDR